MSYEDGGSDSKATVMTCNGTAWTTVGVAGFSAGMADFPSLALNRSTGAPYLVFVDYGDGIHGRATVMTIALPAM